VGCVHFDMFVAMLYKQGVVYVLVYMWRCSRKGGCVRVGVTVAVLYNRKRGCVHVGAYVAMLYKYGGCVRVGVYVAILYRQGSCVRVGVYVLYVAMLYMQGGVCTC